MTKTIAAAALLFTMGLGNAGADDLKGLMPCKSAAARLCDTSQGLTAAALWQCGATLASRRHEVGHGCLAVLKKYGQLGGDALTTNAGPTASQR
jgi:hypothetical protein